MRKSFILALSCIIAVVLLTLTGAFISSVVSEKYFSDREASIMQTINVSEAGINHGTEELRNKVLVELNTAVANYSNTSAFTAYVDSNTEDDDSLDFLCDFLGFSYVTNKTDEVESVFSSSSLPQGSALADIGSYSGKIIVKKQKDSSGNTLQAYAIDPSNPNTFIFPYEFIVESTGTVSSIGKSLRLVQGEFEATVQRANFARFALFTNQHRSPRGYTVWFTGNTSFDGPVHSNDRLSFANNPSGYFTDEVTQHLTKARFYNRGRSRLLDANSNSDRDVPTFENGFQRGVDSLNLESAVTQNDLRTQALGTMNEPGSNGIYVPNNGLATTGGIYIRGNSRINMSVDGSNKAVYMINQGSGSQRKRKEIILNYQTNQTQVKEYDWRDNLTSDNTYAGLPKGQGNEGVIVYSRDDITRLSGTVQKDAKVTISSSDDIKITNHIRYQQYDSSPTVNAENYQNLLGILSWGGDVRIGDSAPSNLDLHAVIMAIHGVFTVDDYRSRSPSGNVNLLGGVITDKYGPFGTFSGTTQRSGYGRNFIYDRRMLGAMSPPYFPTATDFMATAPLLDRNIGQMNVIWQDRD